MLVALLAAFLLGSAGTSALLEHFDQAQASLKAQVEHRERRNELVSIIEDAERAIRDAGKDMGKDTGQLVAQMRSYEGKAADMLPAAQRVRAEVEAAQEEVIRARFELRSRMSREEWSKAFAR